MARTYATAKKRGGVFLWVFPGLLLGLSTLADAHVRPEVESRILFQMGVLAHEQGNDDEARRLMNERVEHAKRNPGLGLLHGAQSSLAELEQRIAEEHKSPAPSTGAH